MMTDDFYNPEQPEQDLHSCGCGDEVGHRLVEFIVDPGSEELSASRINQIGIVVVGCVLASALVICGFAFNVPQAFSPAAVIITGLIASNSGVYWGSTRKEYRCNADKD